MTDAGRIEVTNCWTSRASQTPTRQLVSTVAEGTAVGSTVAVAGSTVAVAGSTVATVGSAVGVEVGDELSKLDDIRRAWEVFFADSTDRRGTVNTQLH